ncbi:hypothetical protein J5U23_00385 [Saccharolobus shibatae B12]|uniref:Uncharacterized protein n=1 Tax=Saccharolobus shibatae (strain ATCC 51178 / DSM 5389 / JCM 8931 / NBRC 15437 / B12) TaxID=523848 RepID=A0A8F5BLT5_SACSH|nr:hypothetical protein J5U23_00385 [Saccharolobus shibatae B12]
MSLGIKKGYGNFSHRILKIYYSSIGAYVGIQASLYVRKILKIKFTL